MKLPIIHIIYGYLLIGGSFAFVNVSSAQSVKESGDMICFGDEVITVTKNESVTLTGDLKAVGNVSIQNSGSIVFNGNYNRYIDNQSNLELFSGTGKVVVTGNADLNIVSLKPMLFHNLEMNTQNGASLICDNSVLIENNLMLNSGTIEIFKGYALQMLSKNSDAIQATFDASAKSYVIGNLKRKVSYGSTYIFPIGDHNGYFPVQIENNIVNAQELNAAFINDISTNYRLNVKNDMVTFNEIVRTGGWNITTDNSSITGSFGFTGMIEHFKSQTEIKNNLFGLVMCPDPNKAIPIWNKAGEMPLLGAECRKAASPVAQATNVSKLGLFALATGVETQFVNFIAPGEGRESRFIIEDIEEFIDSELTLFDATGKELFRSKPYRNNLDMKDYKNGTYYYIFNYTLDGVRYSKQNFIDVKASF